MSADQKNLMAPENPVLAGRITIVYGVKGWVKVFSYTEPMSNILQYQPWWLRQGDAWQRLECDQHQGNSSKGKKPLSVHLVGVDDRDQAKTYCQRDIYISGGQLAVLPEGEFYWHQLLGFAVYSQYQEPQQIEVQSEVQLEIRPELQPELRLGVVKSLLETGANDVLVVAGDKDSVDKGERLIPYIDNVILSIDPESRRIDVDWDPEF